MAEIQLAGDYNEVHKRDGTTIFVTNFSARTPAGFESFTSGNSTYTLKDFEKIKFEGDHVIEDVQRAYPQLSIRDFEERPNSTFTLAGERFNVGPSGMFMGVTFAVGGQTISVDAENPSVINSLNTSNFYSSGHIFTSARQLIEYTEKTATTFTGYVKTGTNILNNNDEMIQFSGPE
jgi:hypothetical protein